jgi:hypothetical protein
MWQNTLNTILAAGLVALIGFLCAGIKAFGDVGIAYVQRKKDALIAKIGADTYDHDLTAARFVWGAVDEKFRITPTLEKTIANKQAEFATMIQKAIPGITDDEIEQLRQAVAGEVNKGREVLTAPAAPAPHAATQMAANAQAAADTAINAATPAAQPESGAVASDTTGAV